jgi:hypothetical protein
MNEDYINEKIKEAADAINQAPQLGEAAYNIADGILGNLKAFIHDDKLWENITVFEKKTHVLFGKKLQDAKKELATKDPLFQWRYGMKYYMDMRHWKSLELLTYWDTLVKEHKEL